MPDISTDEPALARVADTGPWTRRSLRTTPAVAAWLCKRLDLACPDRINQARERGAHAILMLGPDEWLLLSAGEGPHPADAAASGEAAPGPLALIEISHRNTGLELAGPGVEDVLAGACPLPLDRLRFPVGRATRTLLGKVECVLWRRADDRFHIEVARSLAPYARRLLTQLVQQEAALTRSAQSPL